MVATTWIGVIGTPTDRLAKVGLVIEGPKVGLMVKLTTLLPVNPPELVALKFVVKVPLVVGVPDTTPVVGFRAKPGGNVLGAITA